MQTLETLRTIRTKNFSLVVRAVVDPEPPGFLDPRDPEDLKTLRQIDRGDLAHFGVVVVVCAQGIEVGTASLWDCNYTTPKEFDDHLGLAVRRRAAQAEENSQAAAEAREPRRISYGSYFSDLVREALCEARERLLRLRGVPLNARS